MKSSIYFLKAFSFDCTFTISEFFINCFPGAIVYIDQLGTKIKHIQNVCANIYIYIYIYTHTHINEKKQSKKYPNQMRSKWLPTF